MEPWVKRVCQHGIMGMALVIGLSMESWNMRVAMPMPMPSPHAMLMTRTHEPCHAYAMPMACHDAVRHGAPWHEHGGGMEHAPCPMAMPHVP